MTGDTNLTIDDTLDYDPGEFHIEEDLDDPGLTEIALRSVSFTVYTPESSLIQIIDRIDPAHFAEARVDFRNINSVVAHYNSRASNRLPVPKLEELKEAGGVLLPCYLNGYVDADLIVVDLFKHCVVRDFDPDTHLVDGAVLIQIDPNILIPTELNQPSYVNSFKDRFSRNPLSFSRGNLYKFPAGDESGGIRVSYITPSDFLDAFASYPFEQHQEYAINKVSKRPGFDFVTGPAFSQGRTGLGGRVRRSSVGKERPK